MPAYEGTLKNVGLGQKTYMVSAAYRVYNAVQIVK